MVLVYSLLSEIAVKSFHILFKCVMFALVPLKKIVRVSDTYRKLSTQITVAFHLRKFQRKQLQLDLRTRFICKAFLLFFKKQIHVYIGKIVKRLSFSRRKLLDENN